MIYLLVFSLSLQAQVETYYECIGKILRFSGLEGSEEVLQDFLRLQGKLTIHKLAYSLVRGSVDQTRFKVEDKIKALTGQLNDQYAEEIQSFNNNPVSRRGIAQILPLVKDILNGQNDFKDNDSKELYDIHLSDLNFLGILAEQEEIKANGKFNSAFVKKNLTTFDKNAVLNFTKIINSSLRDKKIDQKMVKSLQSSINKTYKELDHLVGKLNLGDCKNTLAAACVAEGEVPGYSVLVQNISNTINFLGKSDQFDKYKKLQFNDVWLKIDEKDEDIFRPSIVTPSLKSENIDQELNDYFISIVLAKYPAFFTREDLKKNLELLYATADALETGADTFDYQGKRYYLPRMVNFSIEKEKYDRSTPDEKVKFYEDIITRYNKSPTRFTGAQQGEFWETWLKQKYFSRPPQLGSFVFDNKLYNMETGERVVSSEPSQVPAYSQDAFLSLLAEATPKKSSNRLEEFKRNYGPRKGAIGEAMKAHQKSYAFGGKVYHLSGSEVDFDRVYRNRKKMAVEEIEVTESGKISQWQDFLSLRTPRDVRIDQYTQMTSEKIKERLGSNPVDMAALTLSLANGERFTLLSNGSLVDSVGLETVSDEEKRQIIVRHQNTRGLPVALLGRGTEYRDAFSAAIFTKKPTFIYKKKEYLTESGEEKKGDVFVNSNFYMNWEDRKKLEADLNQKDDHGLVVAFHQKFQGHPQAQCDFYTLIDKKKFTLEVRENGGRLLLGPVTNLLGSQKGDQRTIFLNNEDDYEKRKTNRKTGAGIYIAKGIKRETTNRYYGQYRDTLMSLGYEEGSAPQIESEKAGVFAIHSIPRLLTGDPYFFENVRTPRLDSESLDDNRISAGCVNLSYADAVRYRDLVENYKGKQVNCPVYVLPEEEKNRFLVENGKLRFVPKESEICVESDQKQIGICDRDYLYSPTAKKNYFPASYSTKNGQWSENDTVKEVLKTLAAEKEKLMKAYSISNDDYNRLVKFVYGVIGVETTFGTSDKYRAKELSIAGLEIGQFTVRSVKRAQSAYQNPGEMVASMLSGGIEMLIPQATAGGSAGVTSGADHSDNSRGLSQIKMSWFEETITKHYPEISGSNLDNPRNAAIATMIVAVENLRTINNYANSKRHSAITSENKMDFLYYQFNGQGKKVSQGTATPHDNMRTREVMRFMDEVEVFERIY